MFIFDEEDDDNTDDAGGAVVVDGGVVFIEVVVVGNDAVVVEDEDTALLFILFGKSFNVDSLTSITVTKCDGDELSNVDSGDFDKSSLWLLQRDRDVITWWLLFLCKFVSANSLTQRRKFDDNSFIHWFNAPSLCFCNNLFSLSRSSSLLPLSLILLPLCDPIDEPFVFADVFSIPVVVKCKLFLLLLIFVILSSMPSLFVVCFVVFADDGVEVVFYK